MQKNIILNLAGAVALALLCSCGQSAEQKDVQPVVPPVEEQVQEVLQQEAAAVEMPEVMTDTHQEAFAEFPDDNDDNDNDDTMFDYKA